MSNGGKPLDILGSSGRENANGEDGVCSKSFWFSVMFDFSGKDRTEWRIWTQKRVFQNPIGKNLRGKMLYYQWQKLVGNLTKKGC